MLQLYLYTGNSTLIQFFNLRSGVDNTPKSGAVVTATLYASDMVTTVPGVSPIQLTDVTGAPGNYQGRIDQSITQNLASGTYYILIDAVSGTDDFHKFYKVRIKPLYQ